MTIVNMSYLNADGFTDPEVWLHRIDACTGILEKLADKNEVTSIEQINYEGRLTAHNVSYHFLNFKKKKNYFPHKLHEYIKGLKPDVILVNGLIFPLQVMQLRRKMGRSVKIIAQHHAEKPFTGIKRTLQRLADHCIDTYLFTSREMGQEWVQKGIIANEGKIAEVMEASSRFHREARETALQKTKAAGDPVFLWVGRLNANKNPVMAVKAFLQFRVQYPRARLYMIYHTEELKKEIEHILDNVGTQSDAVMLIGKVARNDMQSWFSSADFFISASYYEGSGIAVCEAMSCGCIPVLTDITSFRKMTGYGKCGILYEPGNEQALISALLQTQKLQLEEERRKVLQQFREDLSFDAIAGKIQEIIVPRD